MEQATPRDTDSNRNAVPSPSLSPEVPSATGTSEITTGVQATDADRNTPEGKEETGVHETQSAVSPINTNVIFTSPLFCDCLHTCIFTIVHSLLYGAHSGLGVRRYAAEG